MAIIKFQTNIAQQVTFPYGDAQEVESSFLDAAGNPKKQFLYKVGQDDRLYATPNMHERLIAAGVGAGVTLRITKIELDGGRSGWDIYNETTGGEGGAPPPNNAAPEPQRQTANTGGSPPTRQPDPARAPVEVDIVVLMMDCLKIGKELHKAVFGVDTDPQARCATAHSLFISAKQMGMARLSMPGPVTANPPARADGPPVGEPPPQAPPQDDDSLLPF